MALEDLNPDQNPIDNGLRMDMGRMPANVHRNIAVWKQMAQAGQDPRNGMRDAARGFLGRIWRAMQAIAETPADFDEAASRIGMTRAQVQAQLEAWESAMTTFRDAPMGTVNQARNAVNALEAVFTLPRPRSTRNFFLDKELPTTRPI